MRLNGQPRTALAVLAILAGACSSSAGVPANGGTGAAPGSGGTSSIGSTGTGGLAGATAATTTGSGGRVGSGGVTSRATGGSQAPGGASGGIPGTGGSQSFGGTNATGGISASSVPAGSGGRTGAGGTSSDVGRDALGSDAGRDAPPDSEQPVDAARADAPGTGDVAGTSPGCGAGKTTSSCGKSGGTKCTLTSNAKTREFYLILPASYDASRSYPVVVMLHGMIATAEMALSWFSGIPKDMPDAIYIAPQGLKHAETGGGANGQEVTGWANVDGEDIQFMKDLVSTAGKDYCVDTQRVFAVGFSYGGMFSYAIGCELGGVFRAIAPMSGALLSGCKLSGRPVAMWGSHGTSDSLVPIASGRQARDKILQQNHCGTATVPIEPSPCVAYQGCDEGYPVTWCEWDGDHNRPPFGNSAVAAFFKQF